MARRSLFVAIAATVAALLPAAAHAATPGFAVGYAQYASPVTLSWTPDATRPQTLFRAPGALRDASHGRAGRGRVRPAVPPFPGAASDAPGDGDVLLLHPERRPRATAERRARSTVDTLAPTPRSPSTPDQRARRTSCDGAVTVTGTQRRRRLGRRSRRVICSSALSAPVRRATAIGALGHDGLGRRHLLTSATSSTTTRGHAFDRHPARVVVDNTAPDRLRPDARRGRVVSGNRRPAAPTDARPTRPPASATCSGSAPRRATSGWANAIGGRDHEPGNGYRRNWNTDRGAQSATAPTSCAP